MNVQIQSVKFDADRKLIDYIEQRFEKLDRFDDSIISAEAILKLDHDQEHGNKVVVLKLSVKGDDLVAERRSRSFEDAVDECYEAIRKQIEKRKTNLK